MTKSTFKILENEEIWIEAKVGKKIFHFYVFLQMVAGIFATGILLPGIIWFSKIEKGFILFFLAALLYAVVIFLVGHYHSTKKRRYVLTNKRVVIIKGGKFKRISRSLSLKSIQGLQKCNNFLYDRYGLATIDFYALAVGSNMTKFKLISFSSTDFKFQWVDKNDADKVYDIMQSYLVNNTL